MELLYSLVQPLCVSEALFYLPKSSSHALIDQQDTVTATTSTQAVYCYTVLIGAYLDPKNVARLVQIFKLEGCDRLDIEHRVPVLIDSQILRQSLVASRKSNSDLLGEIPPTLSFPVNTQLKCLHGRYRLAAAKEFLEHGNKWWTVDFYDQTTLSEDIQKDIREDYANSRNFCDGDIFRQIRYC